jgi:S1-C subfamily serine protease
MSDLSSAVGRVEAKLDFVIEKQVELEARTRVLEHKLTWKNVVVSAIVACATAFATAFASGCVRPPVQHPTQAEVTKAEAATVKISGMSMLGGYTGTGFFIAPDRIGTAGHMCEEGDFYQIETSDGTLAMVYPVLDSDTDPYDICVMQVVGYESKDVLKVSRETPVMGDVVWYVGYPNGALSEQEGRIMTYQEGYYRASIPGYPGASGSALLNEEGEVVGVLHGYYPYDFNNILFAPVTGII